MRVRAVAMTTKFGQKNCTHHFSAGNREIFCMYSGDFGAGEFQYDVRNFIKLCCEGVVGIDQAHYCKGFICTWDILPTVMVHQKV